MKSSLFEQGFILHVGHNGEMCPRNQSQDNDWEDVPILGDEALDSGLPFGIDNEAGLSDVMVITDSAGVFQHRLCGVCVAENPNLTDRCSCSRSNSFLPLTVDPNPPSLSMCWTASTLMQWSARLLP